MAYFKVSLFTPSRILLKDFEATEVIIPTSRGEVDILPEHTHFVTELGTGVITLKNAQGTQHFTSTTGLCKVLKNEIIILAHTSEKSSEIDRTRAEKALALSKEKLSGKETLDDNSILKFQRKLARAEVRLKLALASK
ncbi:MAG: ATP synthase F1 subunit epsilon [Bacteriovoracaceae bacterium]|nr:ATP synthase F1 subunit epsilon [Bacteriovoracaceae bacterium]